MKDKMERLPEGLLLKNGSVVDGETGLLFSEQTPESLAEALQRFEQCEGDFDPRHLHAHAEKFSTENFLTGFRHEVEAAMARL